MGLVGRANNIFGKPKSNQVSVGHGYGMSFTMPAPAPPAAPSPVFGNTNGMQGIGGTTRGGQTPAQYYAPPAGNSFGGGPISGGGGAIPAPAPVAPPKPTYSMSDDNGRIAQVDSTFGEQESAYNEALKKFVANLGKRRTSLETDTQRSRDGIAKNRTLGLTGLGEDFAARGLGHSGLYVDATEKAKNAYKQQDDSVVDALADGKEELNFSESKERGDTSARIQQAKRDALYRLQMNNNLVTGL